MDPDRSNSLHQWVIGSREGDSEALNQLAEYLLPMAFRFANQKMQNLGPMEDYEDIAVSAVKSICVRFQRGQSEFLGEKQLGSLLRSFVVGKIRDRRKYYFAEKRDIKKVSNENLSNDNDSNAAWSLQDQAINEAKSIWLDEQSISLPAEEQDYLEQMLDGLGADVQGLFSELVKRLDEKPRKVLMLITAGSSSTMEMAEAMDCAPSSIERHRRSIRNKLEEIVNE